MGARQQLRGQPEARGDGERVALAGTVVEEPERRGQGGAVELHGRVAGAGVGARERLQWLEVGGGHHQGSACLEVLQDGLGERRALVGVGPRPELVEQHERALVGGRQDLADLRDEGRERREMVGDTLIVPDDGEHPVEDGKP